MDHHHGWPQEKRGYTDGCKKAGGRQLPFMKNRQVGRGLTFRSLGSFTSPSSKSSSWNRGQSSGGEPDHSAHHTSTRLEAKNGAWEHPPFPQVCLHQLTSSFPILSAQLHNRWSPVTYNLRRVLWECGLHRAKVLTVSINCKQAMVILWSLLLCTLTVYKPSTLPILYNGTLLASHQVTPMATPPMAHSLPHHYFRVTQKLYREQNPSCISRVLIGSQDLTTTLGSPQSSLCPGPVHQPISISLDSL